VAGVAHEVRNPIFGLSATLDAFEAEFGDREDYREYLAVLRGQLQRVSGLMKDLMEYGRPHSVRLEPGPIESVVTAASLACRELAERAGVRLRTETGAEALPLGLVDKERLAQVFQNLIENAIQHTPRRGEVVVTLSCRKAVVQCEVCDNGPGFRAEDLPRLFEPFFTRRPGGTGLGLAICQRIVKEHAGTLTLENNPAGGARAVLRVPTAP
jgi:signal transduction histidine kinase